MRLDPQAEQLNKQIEADNPSVMRLLSRRGRGIFFPSKGIIQQSADARGAKINATIGTALEDDGGPMALGVLRDKVKLDPSIVFNYAPPYGRPEMRDTWEKAMSAKNPSLAGATFSKPVVTAALTHGIAMGAYLFVDENDTVITPDYYWENYELIFGNACGGRLSTFPMFSDGGFNVEGLRTQLNSGAPGKRIVILNFPNNPTGYTVTTSEAQALRKVIVEAADAGNDILVMVDDAYFGLVFEPGVLTESMFGLLAGAHERVLALKFDGPTKEDYVWGLRVGFATFGCKRSTPALYAALEQKLAGAIRGNISNVSNLSQSLLAAAYKDPSYESQKVEKAAVLRRRYQEIRAQLAAHAEYSEVFEPLPYNSGYFMCLKMKDGIEADAVRKRAREKYGVGVIALGQLLRLAFSSTPLSAVPELLGGLYRAACEVRDGVA